MSPFVIIFLICLAVSIVSALLLMRKGYPFWRTFIGLLIGLTGVGVLGYNMVAPYL